MNIAHIDYDHIARLEGEIAAGDDPGSGHDEATLRKAHLSIEISNQLFGLTLHLTGAGFARENDVSLSRAYDRIEGNAFHLVNRAFDIQVHWQIMQYCGVAQLDGRAECA